MLIHSTQTHINNEEKNEDNVILIHRLSAALTGAILMFGATTNCAMADLTYMQADLQGIKTMSVLVESIDSNSCGITTDQVKTALLYTLSQSKISVIPKDGVPTDLYVNITILPDCSAAEVILELQTIAVIRETNRTAYMATVWDTEDLLTGGDMESRVDSAVNELTQKFVVDWNAANP
jgi:hypothetical protein